jgi:transposase
MFSVNDFQHHYCFAGREAWSPGHQQYRARPAAGTRQASPIGRDHEYERLGTCSILAALDLQDGHVTARVEDRHRSVEFIGLLSDLDAKYPPECIIRIILDNHSAHISKETHTFLSKHPNRFQYVLTPKHGSWLNIVETLFGKMARTFLRHIRVQSLDELKARILYRPDILSSGPAGTIKTRIGRR